MLTADERVASLHARMASRRRRRERRKTQVLSASCAGLTLCLLFLIFGEGAAHRGGAAGVYSGATMLFENAGGYVVTALAAFAVGTLVTVLCLRSQKRSGRNGNGDKREPDEEPRESKK